MTAMRAFRGLLSGLLAVALFLSFFIPGLSAKAAETTEMTAAAESEETTIPTEPPETTAATEVTIPEETVEETVTEDIGREWNLYFGLLHAHTDISDGQGSVSEAFQYATNVEGLDFFAVTDHSNSFDNANSGAIHLDGSAVSADWAAGKAAAAAVTNAHFVGMFGYEMTWRDNQNLGHINTFHTPGWQSVSQEGFDTLESYYEVLSTVPGAVSQFNHPGRAYGEFVNFTNYNARYDAVIQLLEVSSEDGYSAYDYYEKALLHGWHVAPTNSQNNHDGSWGDASQARTVVLAKSLTEESLYDAMANRRVYATEDGDLSISYQLDGQIMGSVLRYADNPVITVSLEDPTNTVGLVEVVAEGTIIDARQVDSPSADLTIPVPGGYRYYYLRITREDRIIAVTAPVWVDTSADAGIAAFTADSDLPVQGRELNLKLELYNDEAVDISVEKLEVFVNGEAIYHESNPGTLPALGSCSYSFPFAYSGLGEAAFRAVATVNAEGRRHTCEASLTLYYQLPETVGAILVDGGHGNYGIGELNNLSAIAAGAGMDVTVFTEGMPADGKVLIISAPESELEAEFIGKAAQFAENGGTLILCGQAGSASRLNPILTAANSTMRLNDDTAVDDVNNGGAPDALFPAVFNSGAQWCAGITREQFYSQHSGCTVDPGNGTWLVKSNGDVLLAWEELPSGGKIFAAGCFFLMDREMPLPENKWDPLRANQTILEEILNIQRPEYTLSDIKSVYSGGIGTVYRIRGYVTAGNSCEYNTFPGTIYLQDHTGGIAVVNFPDADIQVGTHLEVLGRLNLQGGNTVLELIRYDITGEDAYAYDPKTISNKTAMDYAEHGGELLQVQGQVVSIEYHPGGGVSKFMVKDILGDTATVFVEDYIRSAKYGTNTLVSLVQPGRTIQARGLLCLDAEGHPMLRIRNCDEVIYIPPAQDPTNPKTGDGLTCFFKDWIR